MTLEELTKLTTAAALKAHVLIDRGFANCERVKSVSVRVDDDGTTSVLLHTAYTDKRITTEEVDDRNAIVEAVRQLRKSNPEIAENLANIGDFYISHDELWQFFVNQGVDVSDSDTVWSVLDRFFGVENMEAKDGKQTD